MPYLIASADVLCVFSLVVLVLSKAKRKAAPHCCCMDIERGIKLSTYAAFCLSAALLVVAAASLPETAVLFATSPVEADDLVVPDEANVADNADPTYRVFRLMTLNASATSFRFSAASLQPQVAPEDGVVSGLVSSSTLASLATNCTKMVLIDGDAGVNTTAASAPVQSQSRRWKNLLASLSSARLVPTSPTQAMLYILPNRRVYQDWGTGAVVVRLVVHPICLVDTASGGGAVPAYPVNASFHIMPLSPVVSGAQDLFLTTVLGVGMLVAPHAATHGPRIAMPMVTRRCLATAPTQGGTVAGARLPLYQHPTMVNVGGADDDGLDASIGVVAVEGSVMSGLVVLHAAAFAVLVWRRRRVLGIEWRDARLQAMFALRWPSLSVLWTLPFLTQLSMASATLLFSGSSRNLALIGVWGMSWCLVVALGMLLMLFACYEAQYVPLWNHAAHAPPPDDALLQLRSAAASRDGKDMDDTTLLRIAASEQALPPLHAPKHTPASAMLSWCFGRGKWEDEGIATQLACASAGTPMGDAAVNAHDAIGAGSFTRGARLLLLEYDDRGSFFIVADMAMCAVCGALQAVHDAYDGCGSLLIAELVVLGLYLCAVVCRRPFRSGYVIWFAGLLTLVELASCAWELWRTMVPLNYTAYANGDHRQRDAVSRGIVNAGIVVLSLKATADATLALYACARCMLSPRSDHGRGAYRERCAQGMRAATGACAAAPTPSLSPQLVDEALNELWAIIVATIDDVKADDRSQLGPHNAGVLQEMASSCLELAIAWSSLPSTHTPLDFEAMEQETLQALSAIENACYGIDDATRPDRAGALLRRCEAVRRSVTQAAHAVRSCHGDDHRSCPLSGGGGREPAVDAILLFQPEVESRCAPLPRRKKEKRKRGAQTPPVAVEWEESTEPLLREDEMEAMSRIESMHTLRAPEGAHDPHTSPRFRASRAILEHVVNPRSNYVVAPSVSRAAFLQNASRPSTVSRFNPNTHPVSSNLPRFDDM